MPKYVIAIAAVLILIGAVTLGEDIARYIRISEM